MKLSKETLKTIIKEELEATLSEMRSFNPSRGSGHPRPKRRYYDGQEETTIAMHPNMFAKKSGEQAAKTANIKNIDQLKKAIKDFGDKMEEVAKNPNWQGNVLSGSLFRGKNVFFHVNDIQGRREALEMLFRESFMDNAPDDFEFPENETGEVDVVDGSPLDSLM